MSMMPLRVRLRLGRRCDDDDGECVCPRPSLARDLFVACAPIALTGALEWWLRQRAAPDEDEMTAEVEAPKPKRRAR
jgi:hypothetical protein